MKNFLFILTFILPTLAFATGGMTCKELTGDIQIDTDEASIGGDNLISVNLQVEGKSYVMTKNSVSRDVYPATVYMAADGKGNMLTLVKDVAKFKVGNKFVNVSRAYVRLADRRIFQENVVCE